MNTVSLVYVILNNVGQSYTISSGKIVKIVAVGGGAGGNAGTSSDFMPTPIVTAGSGGGSGEIYVRTFPSNNPLVLSDSNQLIANIGAGGAGGTVNVDSQGGGDTTVTYPLAPMITAHGAPGNPFRNNGGDGAPTTSSSPDISYSYGGGGGSFTEGSLVIYGIGGSGYNNGVQSTSNSGGTANSSTGGNGGGYVNSGITTNAGGNNGGGGGGGSGFNINNNAFGGAGGSYVLLPSPGILYGGGGGGGFQSNGANGAPGAVILYQLSGS